jgi:cellulose synthase/poly-beta-1,6-N-acetylglucosamine synthase-like glycosyltransferase
MHSLMLVIFIGSLLLIMHTYLFYPLVMMVLYPRPRTTPELYGAADELPAVAVLIAAYNEENVIREKIISVFGSTYPVHKIKVYVGSDASEDETDTLVTDLKEQYANLELVKFNGRVGKISIINHLQSLGDEDILIMTDANVIFRPATILELVKYFKDERVGIVAANIIKESPDNEGISFQEKKYLTYENRLKASESNAFNLIMGAEGGCYAIRNDLFSKVPLKFIVDDFFITLQVLIRKKFTLFNPSAMCIEDVPSDILGEYKRKVRISSGNFQNLFFFKRMLLKFWTPLGFTFWSHKVLRWLTPFFLLTGLLASAFLMFGSSVFIIIFIIQLAGFIFPLLNHLFRFQNTILRFISHFYLMNFALLEGFFKFVGGIKSSVWQPVKRNV